MLGLHPTQVPRCLRVHAATGSAVAQETLERIGALYTRSRGGLPASLPISHDGNARLDHDGWPTPSKPGPRRTSHSSPAAPSWPTPSAICWRDGRTDTRPRRWPHRARQQPRRPTLRGVAVGRKNYLFAGSEHGAERAAPLYSLIECAKLNGIDPEAYLRDILSRIADHPAQRLTDLLP